ncbi:unnamed protein product [Sphagnum compactum]
MPIGSYKPRATDINGKENPNLARKITPVATIGKAATCENLPHKQRACRSSGERPSSRYSSSSAQSVGYDFLKKSDSPSTKPHIPACRGCRQRKSGSIGNEDTDATASDTTAGGERGRNRASGLKMRAERQQTQRPLRHRNAEHNSNERSESAFVCQPNSCSGSLTESLPAGKHTRPRSSTARRNCDANPKP